MTVSRRVLLILACVASIAAAGLLIDRPAAHAGGGVPELRVRVNVRDLTPQQRQDFVQAILALKRTPSPWNPHLSYYNQFVVWHVQAMHCSVDAAHMRPSFLPWHREFLLLFEDALRKVSGKPITVPYWDWTDPASTAAVFRPDFMGGNGNPRRGWALTTGPFRRGAWKLQVVDPDSWIAGQRMPREPRFIIRHFGSIPRAPSLPTKANIARALSRPDYDVPPYDVSSDVNLSFRNYLEGWRQRTGMTCSEGDMAPVPPGKPSKMHNAVHLWVGGEGGTPQHPLDGTMTLNSSPDDPVFWLTHAYVDLLWTRWEARHGEVYQPVSGQKHGQNLHDTMWPYNTIGDNIRIDQLLDDRALGYRYDVQPPNS